MLFLCAAFFFIMVAAQGLTYTNGESIENRLTPVAGSNGSCYQTMGYCNGSFDMNYKCFTTIRPNGCMIYACKSC